MQRQNLPGPEIASFAHWQKIGMRDHHGIALHLSSLRENEFSAIGEYLDLIPLLNWCKSVGFDVIQLLPLNDSGHDPSPYSAHTSIGLHPIYLKLSALPYLKDEDVAIPFVAKRVQYQNVLNAKLSFLQKYADTHFEKIAKLPAFIEFAKQKWVQEYAEYQVLKEKNQDRPWWEWQDRTGDKKREQFYILLQYLCFDQMAQVKAAADREGVFLKGDIPILINRDSCDVYKHPELFKLDCAAGAPPDMYSSDGQNWGFPLYNWRAIEEQGFHFWIQRLHIAEKLYHLYRLDHIVGFFRIWAIPLGQTGKSGFFIPEDINEWIPQGKKIMLTLLQNSQMLPIGEDLGVVPTEVRTCLSSLGIPGTKVIRWERRWQTDRSFIDPKTFDPISMTCLSTHDSETLSQWWENDSEEVSVYAGSMGLSDTKLLDKEQRKKILTASHTSQSLFHINLLQEYLAMFDELRWDNPNDDRINIPGKILDENWTYRFRPTMEALLNHKGLQVLLKELSQCQK